MNREWLMRAWRSPIVALAIAATIIAIQLARKPDRGIYADETQYLAVSLNLAWHGVFSDRTSSPDSAPQPNAFFAPAAPFLYSVLIRADVGTRESIVCQLAKLNDPTRQCEIAYGWLVRLVMGTLAAIGVWGTWLLARQAGFAPLGSWVAVTVVALSGTHAYFARHFLTEPLLLAVFPFLLCLLAMAANGQRRSVFVGLGMALGALALIRPSYGYLAYAVIAAMPLLRRFCGAAPVGAFHWKAAALAAIGYAVMVLPWMTRNALVVGDFALTTGYDTNILVQRLIYNQMSWQEWAMAWIYWLPDFGDTWAISLFGEDAIRRLSLIDPAGYHGAGNPPVPPYLAAQPDGSAVTLGYLLGVIADNAVKHVLVTLVMAWQGLWAGKYVTLVAVLLLPLALPAMAAAGQLRTFIVVAAPVLFMVGFHAFVSVSVPRYNLAMLWPDALVAAAVAERGRSWIGQRMYRTRHA